MGIGSQKNLLFMKITYLEIEMQEATSSSTQTKLVDCLRRHTGYLKLNKLEFISLKNNVPPAQFQIHG